MKAVLHFSAGDRLRERLQCVDGLEIIDVSEHDTQGLARELASADVLLHVLAPVTSQVISMGPRLKLIQKIGVGVDAIDRVAARKAGIAIANMPGTNTAAVAEHTLALLLAVLRKIPAFDAAMRTGDGWSLPPGQVEALGELKGARVGFVGYGAVAQSLSPVLAALGAESVHWNRRPSPSQSSRQIGFDELIATSDVLSLQLPLTPETRHIISRSVLAKCKRGVVIINTARGGLIDQDGLIDALRSGHISGAGLDVFEQEPSSPSLFESCANVVLSPHVAWLTPQTFQRSLEVVRENCSRIRDGRPILHEILD